MKRFVLIILVVFWQFKVLGQSIEGFLAHNAVDDKTFSLSDYKHKDAIVLIFFSGKCAYGEYYLDRIISIKDEFASQGVQFVLINSNSSAFVIEESVEEMQKFAVQHKLTFPYLADKDKKIKTMLKATRTPEVFILKSNNSQFEVVYKGAIDDNPQSTSDVTHAYLREALINLQNNTKIELNQTRPVGCLIK